MKKLLLLIVTVSVVFAVPHKTQKNFVYGVYKVGDKRTAFGKKYMGLKDGMIIEVIDPIEWPEGAPILSDHMQKCFCIIKHNRDWKTELRDASKSSGSFSDTLNYKVKQKKIDLKKLGTEIGDPYLEDKLRGDSLVLIDGTALKKNILEVVSKKSKGKYLAYYDYNAITTGNATVGSGGDYATFAIAFADLGNLTGDITFTQISDVTETTTAGVSEDLGGYTLTITSNNDSYGDYTKGHLLTIQHNVHMFLLGQESNGVVSLCCLKAIRTVVPNSATRSFALIANVSAGTQTIKVFNNMHNGDQGGNMFSCTDNTPVIHVYNNISWSGYSGITIDGNDGNSNSVYENNSFYNHTVSGITANSGIVGFGTYRNNVCIDNLVDYSDVGAGAIGVNNASGDTTAKDSEWSTGSGNQINLSSATQWVSVDKTTGSFFLKPIANSVIAIAGVEPTLLTNLMDGVLWTAEIGAKSMSTLVISPNVSKYNRLTYSKPIYKNDDYKNFIYNK